MKILFATFVSAGTFFACCLSALALTVSGSATPVAYSGSCPATITLNATMTGGTPGAPVRYILYYFDPSTGRAVGLPVANGKFDASGALVASASVSIAAAQAGNSWVTMKAQTPGAQASAPKTPFSVTCTSATPVVGKYHYHVSMPSDTGPNIAAPTALNYTNDPTECTSRLGGFLAALMCPKILAGGDQLMLIWNWSPCSGDANCVQKIDGYHVYHPSSGASGYAGRNLIASNSLPTPLATQDKQEAMFEFLSGFKSGDCYVVTAFAGNTESQPSNRFCLAGSAALGAQSVTLNPAQMRSSTTNVKLGTGLVASLETALSGIVSGDIARQTWNQQLNALHVGYFYNTNKSISGDSKYNELWRGGIWFDLSSLSGKAVNKATLRFHVARTVLGIPPLENYASSCAAQVGTASRDWWYDTKWIDGDFFSDVSAKGPSISVDVTPQVRSWMQGQTNNGFILKGRDENIDAFTEDSCETVYDNAALDIEYF